MLRALNVPAHQFVELRALIPRSAFTSTSGMQVANGQGPREDRRRGEADAAAARARPREVENAKHHPLRYVLLSCSRSGSSRRSLIVLVVYWLFGRELKTGYDREYEQEPPTDTPPALVPTLLRQGGEAGSFEFTATLFDLIRRGVYTSKPVTTERSIWGGLRKEEVSDLELSPGKRRDACCRGSRTSANVVDGVLDGGSERSLEVPRADREQAHVDGAALHVVQVEGREGGQDAPLVPRHGDRAAGDRACSSSWPPAWSCSSSPRAAGAPPTSAGPTSC